jgi:DNA-binding response OmpR family regulator
VSIDWVVAHRMLVHVTGERILIVEDDERIGSTLRRALDGNGYDVRWEQDGHSAEAAIAQQRPDLVLLDLGLPDSDGLDVCRSIHRHDSSIDVIMLTARDDEIDVVVGLDAGAVDYITKPFKLAELLARVRAQLRRSEPRGTVRMQIGELGIDPLARRVWLGEVEVVLRAKEFDLLARLVADAGIALSRETLMADVWDEHWFGSTKTLDFHIAALRHKIDAAGSASRIATLRGVGYRYEVR